MSRTLYILGWLAIAMAGATVAANPWLPPSVLNVMKQAVPAGVLIALGGPLLTQSRTAKDASEKRSQFYLESCVAAYDQARELLQDENNDRATWIASGRALVHAKELAANVTEDSHQRVLELQRLKYRGFFHDLLSDRPAAFFYGVDPSLDLTTAAAASSAGEDRAGRAVTSTVRQLSPESLYAVWEAAQWPEQYSDPLTRDFSPQERGRLIVLFPGLHEYLDHLEHWASASGRLFSRSERSPPQGRS